MNERRHGAGQPGPSLRTALAVVALGALVAVPSGAMVGLRFYSSITARSFGTPGLERRHLAAGTWFVFQRTGSSHGAAGFTVAWNHGPTVLPAEVEVTGPHGEPCPVRYVTVNETITRHSAIYTAALQFNAPVAGTYTVQVHAARSNVIVTRSLGDTFRGALGWIEAGSAGSLVLVLGLILLLVGAIRRSRVPKPAAGPGAWVGAGWYPDPSGSGRLRYFDGTGWTEHLS